MSEPPRYFMPGEVRALRDKDRRRYRGRVVLLVFYQILVVGPIRYAVDLMLGNPKFGDLAFIQPYVLPAMVALVVVIWGLGLLAAFERKY
jgi:hypothetical protein